MDQPVYDYVMGFQKQMNFIQNLSIYCEQSYLDIKKKVKVASPLQLAVLADNIALLH